MLEKYRSQIRSVAMLCFCLITLPATAQWRLVKNDDRNEVVLDAQILTNQVMFIAGSAGVLKTTNGGNTWVTPEQFRKTVDGGLMENLWFSAAVFYDVHFLNQQNGFATGWSLVNSSELIIQTTDGGVTWKRVYTGPANPSDPTQAIKSIQFPTATVGYASSYKGRVLKTTDGGQNWSVLTTGITGEISTLQFFSATEGLALSENKLYKTSNGGQSWTTTTLPAVGATMHFVNANVGFIGTSATILKTTNGGSTWTSPPMAIDALKFYFTDDQNGYAVGNGVYKTTNGGALWVLQQKDPWEFRGVHALTPSVAIATTFGGEVYVTSNGGEGVVPAITITDFSPQQGLPGTVVTVRGENLDYAHTVTAGDIPVSFKAYSNELSFTVPAGAADEKSIVLQSTRETVYSQQKFLLVKTPATNAFTPKIGIPGALITITGQNFNNATSVLFNDIPTTFTVTNNTTIVAAVPEGNATGRIKIVTPFGESSAYETFTKYPALFITSFTPSAYTRSGNISIYGGTFEYGTTVQLNGVTVPSTVKSAKEIIVNGLPPTAVSGKFTVVNAATTAQSAETFTVLEGTTTPTLTTVAPTRGRLGQSVTIQGTNLYAVTSLYLPFSGSPLTFEVVSDTELRTEIPWYLTGTTGTTKFDGRTADGRSSMSTSSFTIQAGNATPAIQSVNPPAATVQSVVTIVGTSLSQAPTVYFNGVQSLNVRRDGLTRLLVEVPAQAKTGAIKLGETTTSTIFEVLPNYCVPQYMRTCDLHIPWLAVGGALHRNDNVADCKVYFDQTAQVIEAKKGAELMINSAPQRCGGGDPQWPMGYVVYVDWNNDQDFYDTNEKVYQSVSLRPGVRTDVHYLPFKLPATAPATGTFRMRVYATSNLPFAAPCAFLDGAGVSVDFTLKMTDSYTVAPPEFIALHPPVTTHGRTFSLEGRYLSTAYRVAVGDFDTGFSYNEQTGYLDIQVPPGTTSNDLIVLTKGGGLRLTDKLSVIRRPDYFKLAAEPDRNIVGGKTVLSIPDESIASIAHVYFNGVEAAFTEVYNGIEATIPAGATTGKISVVNQFGEYFSEKDFIVIYTPTITSFFPMSAHMGEKIVINGTDFTAATEVQFNGKRVTHFTIVSPTQISADVPYGGSHGKIKVINKQGVAESAVPFTMLPDEDTNAFGEIPSFNPLNLMNASVSASATTFDYDGDGLMDLVVGVNNSVDPFMNKTILRNTGQRTFEPTGIYFWANQCAFGDVNRDGLPDIVTSYGSGIFIDILYNDGKGFKNPPVEVRVPDDLSKWYARNYNTLAPLVDYDNDGDLDIVLSGMGALWFEQQNGTFTLRDIDIPIVSSRRTFLMADIDKDYDMDILADEHLYIQNNGVFQERVLFYKEPIYASLTDYNADGYPDLLLCPDVGGVLLYKNLNGTGFENISWVSEDAAFHGNSWADFYNTGTPGILTTYWDYFDREITFDNFKFHYFDLKPASGVSLRESWFFYNASVEPWNDFIEYRFPRVFLDMDNDGDLDLFMIQGLNLMWPRLFRNYTVERTGRVNKAPSAPETLSIEPRSAKDVILKWTAGKDDLTTAISLSYNVRVWDETTHKILMAPALLGTPHGNAGMAQSYFLRGLDPTHIYSFEVQTIDHGTRASSFTPRYTFTLQTIPSPSALTATGVGPQSVRLQWTDNTTNETGFIVEYRRGDVAQFSLLTTVASNTTSFTAAGLACETSYQFRVQAVTATSVSNFTEPVWAATSAFVPEVSGPDFICSDESITLSAPAGYSAYRWSDGSNNRTLVVSSAGVYTLTAVSAGGCEGTVQKTIVASTTPVAGLTFVTNHFEATGGATYEWYRDNVQLAETGNTLYPTVSGTYKVRATLNGCSAFSEEMTLTITGIEDMHASAAHVSPNPTTGTVTIQTGGVAGQLAIFTSTGTEVYRQALTHADKSITLDLSAQHAGVYLVSIKGEHKDEVHRLVLVK